MSQSPTPADELSRAKESPHLHVPRMVLSSDMSSGRVLDRSVELFCANLRRYAVGEPLTNVVDPAAGY